MNLCRVIPVLAEARVPGFVLEAASEDATDVVMRARATAAAVRRLAVRDVQIARCMRRKKGGDEMATCNPCTSLCSSACSSTCSSGCTGQCKLCTGACSGSCLGTVTTSKA